MFNRFAVFATMLCAVLSSTPNLRAQQSEVNISSSSTVHGRTVLAGGRLRQQCQSQRGSSYCALLGKASPPASRLHP